MSRWRCMDRELVVNHIFFSWRGCLLSRNYLGPPVLWRVLALSKSKWRICWTIVLFLCCHHQEETFLELVQNGTIKKFKHNMTCCNMILVASLRTQMCWVNICFLDRNKDCLFRTVTEELKTASPSFQFLPHSWFPLALFLMEWHGRFRWWRHFLILKDFSLWRYRRTYEVNNDNVFFWGCCQRFAVDVELEWVVCWWLDFDSCVLSKEELFLLASRSSSSLSRDRMTPVSSRGYIYNPARDQFSRSLFSGTRTLGHREVDPKICIDLLTLFEASLSSPGSKLRIQITLKDGI